MNRFLASACIALGAIAPQAFGQSTPSAIPGYELISIYAPVRTSVAAAKGLFTPQGLRGAPSQSLPAFGVGDWIELDLPRDEEGRVARIAYLASRSELTTGLFFDVLAKATDTSPLRPIGELLVEQNENPLFPRLFPLHEPATLVRLVARNATAGPASISWLGVAALTRTRHKVEIVQHSWYLQAPQAGTPAAASLRLPASGSLGLLFGAPGPSILAQHIGVGLPGFGGLLLDPRVAELLQTEVFVGGGWRVDFYFPFDPILLSTPVHFQAALVRLDPLLGTVVTWTPPITF
ncbi:MAG: hypothetical protein JNM84_00630, partial [Planctomycetes bacterium]|nr:hypothetical protein [Planctomycetota bacterium]